MYCIVEEAQASSAVGQKVKRKEGTENSPVPFTGVWSMTGEAPIASYLRVFPCLSIAPIWRSKPSNYELLKDNEGLHCSVLCSPLSQTATLRHADVFLSTIAKEAGTVRLSTVRCIWSPTSSL